MNMKRLNQELAACVVLFLLSASFVSAKETRITLLHVNDTHSHLDATGPKDGSLNGTLGGIAKAATVIQSVRASEEHVLLLHAGDVFQGELFFNAYLGVPELQLMKQLGFDAMAVGNHEFDLGPRVLNDVLSTAFAGGSFPLVSANLDLSAFPALTRWIQPSVIKTFGEVRIGIFGMTVPNNPTNLPAPVIVRDDIVAVAQQAVTDLRSGGAEVVICLSHLGIFYDRMVAANVTGIDFIVGGHDHFVFEHPQLIKSPDGKHAVILQAGEHYKCIGELRFSVNHGKVHVREYRMLPVDASVSPDPSIQSIVSGFKAAIFARYGDVYHTVLATTKTELSKAYDDRSPLRDTPLGNLITDAFRNKTGTDIAITPDGLISEKIWAGPIVSADVFRAVSYGFDASTGLGFHLATFQVVGTELIKGLEVGLSQLEVGDDFFVQVSGMTFKYDPRQRVGQRVIVESIRINDKPLFPDGRYTVTANTGLLELLDGVGVHVERVNVLSDLEYTAVRDYISRLGIFSYEAQGRIQDVSVKPQENARNMRGDNEAARTERIHLCGN